MNTFDMGKHARGSRLSQLGELLLFLLVIFPVVAAMMVLLRPSELTFTTVALHTIVLQSVLLAVAVGLVRWRGEPLAALGLRFGRYWREVQWGVLLFAPMYVGAALLEALLREAGLSGLDAPPSFLVPVGPEEMLLALVFLVVVAIAEEVVFRGYLLLRLRVVLGSPVGAVIVGSIIFALGHGYQGGAGVVTIGAVGAVLALVYLWRGSLVAPMVMHFLQNFLGIVVMPLAVPS
ncbi:CPBP family intramembrane metalloprotease [Ectothiorhodospiraceae bacterium 2226]|nr:CPBP family intramembrane metalloprotease [Ectothiorhodospiraceae bacterium 2226]